MESMINKQDIHKFLYDLIYGEKAVNVKCLRRDQGFTLVELMVVVGLLIIIGSLTTSFTPSSWMSHSRLKGAAVDLYANMQKARMSAIKENMPWAVIFNTANNQYTICPSDTNGTCTDASQTQTITFTDYKSGIGFGKGNATTPVAPDAAIPANFVSYSTAGHTLVVFTPTGLCNVQGYCYLSNSVNEAYAVGTPAASGVIRIRKWDSANWS